jgi:hypothetical protein
MARMVRKGDLPVKTCLSCDRPFAWRKKWARTWDEVKYCSDRCRSAKSGEKNLGTKR